MYKNPETCKHKKEIVEHKHYGQVTFCKKCKTYLLDNYTHQTINLKKKTELGILCRKYEAWHRKPYINA